MYKFERFVFLENMYLSFLVTIYSQTDLDIDAARSGLQKYEQLSREAQNDEDKAVAQIGIDLHQSMIHALQ